MVNLKEEWLSFKDEGNDYFKNNKLTQAVDAYSKGLKSVIMIMTKLFYIRTDLPVT